MSSDIRPFSIDVPSALLDDLIRRLAGTRWPDPETPDDWSQGVPLAYLQDFCTYWQKDYDWRAREAKLNQFDQYLTSLSGLDIHFIHVPSPVPGARPLIMTHGWPGSVLEFLKAIPALTNPEAHGGKAEDAFHLVCPSLPGFGFSGKPQKPGWNLDRIADAWASLMQRLGYSRYFAQGGDWGSAVSLALGRRHAGECAGVHVNFLVPQPDPEDMQQPSELEQKGLAMLKHYQEVESGYARQQATKPQTLGYGLADSPAGQAAWILEKFRTWMDCDGRPESVLTRDELLDNIMFYWVTNSGASSARIYQESLGSFTNGVVAVPAGASMFPKDLFVTSRRWAEKRCSNLVYWNELDEGGHFAALEKPQLFVQELRSCFRLMR